MTSPNQLPLTPTLAERDAADECPPHGIERPTLYEVACAELVGEFAAAAARIDEAFASCIRVLGGVR